MLGRRGLSKCFCKITTHMNNLNYPIGQPASISPDLSKEICAPGTETHPQ